MTGDFFVVGRQSREGGTHSLIAIPRKGNAEICTRSRGVPAYIAVKVDAADDCGCRCREVQNKERSKKMPFSEGKPPACSTGVILAMQKYLESLWL